MHNYGYSATQTEEIRAYPQPVKRFLARMTDRSLFAVVAVLLWILILKRTPVLAVGWKETIFGMVSLVVSVMIEALWLSTIGTTPGKWLFGIHLSMGNGRKLEFTDAFRRGMKRLIFAEAFYIPIISLITLHKSYKNCKQGIVMDYDDYVVYDVKNVPFVLGIIGTIAAEGVAFVLSVVLSIVFMTVPNSGDITTEQFIENYNHLVDYTYTKDTTRRMDEILRFDTRELSGIRYERASITFERHGEGDILEGISTRISAYDDGLYEYRHELLFMTMSLGEGSIKDRLDILFNKVYGMGLDKDVSFTYGKVECEYSVEIDNYKLFYGENIYSKNRGFTRFTYGKNPDGSVNYDEANITEHGRGRHSFEKIKDGEDGTLIINYHINKK